MSHITRVYAIKWTNKYQKISYDYIFSVIYTKFLFWLSWNKCDLFLSNIFHHFILWVVTTKSKGNFLPLTYSVYLKNKCILSFSYFIAFYCLIAKKNNIFRHMCVSCDQIPIDIFWIIDNTHNIIIKFIAFCQKKPSNLQITQSLVFILYKGISNFTEKPVCFD